jgi:hypothetical protein
MNHGVLEISKYGLINAQRSVTLVLMVIKMPVAFGNLKFGLGLILTT